MSKLGIVILSYNTKKLTLDCLESIFKKKWNTKLKVVVVDNNSSDGSVNEIKKHFPKVEVIESKKNLGFAGGNNLGIRKLLEKKVDHILLLNSDTIVKDNSLDNLILFAKSKNYDISSCKLLNPDHTLQPNAGDLPKPIPLFFWISGIDDILRVVLKTPSYQQRNENSYTNDRSVGWVSGAAMLVKSEVFKKIGFLDEDVFMYAEDVDYCWRAHDAGMSVGWTDKAKIIHIGGASSSKPKETQWLGELRGLLHLYRKHYGIVGTIFLKILYYIFIPLRSLSFFTLGRRDYAKTYAKIITKI